MTTVEAGAFPVRPLGDIVEFLDSRRRPITAHERDPGPIPYYGANGVQDYVRDFLFDEPLVLLAEDGGHFDDPLRGIAYGIAGKSWVNNHAHVLRPKPNIDFRFLVRVLEHYDARAFLTGSTRAKLTKSGASRMPVPVPPIEEQRRIAAVLDRADDLRAKRRAALAQLDTLTESIFLDMFGDPVTNATGWPDTLVLGDIAHITSGITKGRRLNGQSTRTVPYLAVANVQDQELRLDKVKNIEATDQEFARFRLIDGDLLLTEGGDPDKLGRGTVWAGELADCIHQNHIFRVRITDQAFVPLFVSRLIASERGRRYFLRSAKQTTGIASINKTQLSGFPLLVAPFELQSRFEARLGDVAARRAALAGSAEQLDDLFASLQQRAFRGEL